MGEFYPTCSDSTSDQNRWSRLCSGVPSEDVSLNPVTAYPFLILSEDRKQVKRGEKLQFFRNSQQRFDVWSCVIAKEGFSSGRHYWEVRTRTRSTCLL